ncbi:MAG: ATP-dependent DNA ligase, partial [Pseudomonadota bacterium]
MNTANPSMPLAALVACSAAVAATRSRLKKREHLAACLREATAAEISQVVHYLSGSLPQGRIGLGPALLRGLSAGSNQPQVSLVDLDNTFATLAGTTGAGSKQRRQSLLSELFSILTEDEASFVLRLVLGELRQGALESILVDALSDATGLAAEPLRRAIMLAGHPAEVAHAALAGGLPALEAFQLTLFRPVQPMLAQPAEDMAGAISTLGTAILDYKLDGARVQIHAGEGQVRIYSRRLNEVTHSLPDICEAVQALAIGDAILDGEVIALGPDDKPLPFQVTMRRFGRRQNVDEMVDKIPLNLFVFDALMLHGEDLLETPAQARFARLEEALPSTLQVPRMETGEPEAAAAFLRGALELGHEGVMAKAPASAYFAGSRGGEWLKIKQAHTLDLVILAAEWGSGRRKGWLSNLHLGARDPDSGAFVMLGKTFKGLTDKTLAWQTEALLERETHREGHVVFVRPELVAEIAFSDIQTSPQYPAGMALRFARVKA